MTTTAPPQLTNHQTLFAQELLRLEEQPIPPSQELRRRARALPMQSIDPYALSWLLATIDGGWKPTSFICRDVAKSAHHAGVRSEHLLAPSGA